MTATLEAPEQETQVALPPVAHMICPACYPVTPAAGTEDVTRWCGLVLPLVGMKAGEDAQRCTICSNATSCATCGATQTRFGLVKVAYNLKVDSPSE